MRALALLVLLGCASSAPRRVTPSAAAPASEPTQQVAEPAPEPAPEPPALEGFVEGVRVEGADDERALVADLIASDGVQTRLHMVVSDPAGWVRVIQPGVETTGEGCREYLVAFPYDHDGRRLHAGASAPVSVAGAHPRVPLDILAAPLREGALSPLTLRFCERRLQLADAGFAAYGEFLSRASELREEPGVIDRSVAMARAAARHGNTVVQVGRDDEPLVELRPRLGDMAPAVAIYVEQVSEEGRLPRECPLTFRGVRGVGRIAMGSAEGSGSGDGGMRYDMFYLSEDLTLLEKLSAARRPRLSTCLGAVPLGDASREAMRAMPDKLAALLGS